MLCCCCILGNSEGRPRRFPDRGIHLAVATFNPPPSPRVVPRESYIPRVTSMRRVCTTALPLSLSPANKNYINPASPSPYPPSRSRHRIRQTHGTRTQGLKSKLAGSRWREGSKTWASQRNDCWGCRSTSVEETGAGLKVEQLILMAGGCGRVGEQGWGGLKIMSNHDTGVGTGETDAYLGV